MAGRTKLVEQHELEDRALDIMFEGDTARAWVLELRNRAILASKRAEAKGLDPTLRQDLASMVADLGGALQHMEHFEQRVTAYEPAATKWRLENRRRKAVGR